jgi:hypothetical protein
MSVADNAQRWEQTAFAQAPQTYAMLATCLTEALTDVAQQAAESGPSSWSARRLYRFLAVLVDPTLPLDHPPDWSLLTPDDLSVMLRLVTVRCMWGHRVWAWAWALVLVLVLVSASGLLMIDDDAFGQELNSLVAGVPDVDTLAKAVDQGLALIASGQGRHNALNPLDIALHDPLWLSQLQPQPQSQGAGAVAHRAGGSLVAPTAPFQLMRALYSNASTPAVSAASPVPAVPAASTVPAVSAASTVPAVPAVPAASTVPAAPLRRSQPRSPKAMPAGCQPQKRRAAGADADVNAEPTPTSAKRARK